MSSKASSDHKPIAIHDSPGSFSDKWIRFCQNNKIDYRAVNCFDTEIVDTVSECSSLMWHWAHYDAGAANFARQLTLSLEARGIPVFPNSRTAWHYDDKLGQKYLFESLEIPHVPTHVFYSENDAYKFLESHGLPVVFKLSRGAGSMNVQLLRTARQAKRAISRSFRRGWKDQNRRYVVSDRIWQFKRDRTLASAVGIAKGVARAVIPNDVHRTPRIESGYVYLQEFVPGNDSDIRVIVVGDRAFGIRRMTRDGDFRASGSGKIRYGRDQVPLECVRLAFESAEKLRAQVVAFDFVYRGSEALVVEASYAFAADAYRQCPGMWDRDLVWHNHEVHPEELMLKVFLDELELGRV